MVIPMVEKDSWESVEQAVTEYKKLGWERNEGKTQYRWIEYNHLSGRATLKIYQVKAKTCACGSNVTFTQYNGTDIFSVTCVCRKTGNGGPEGAILISERAITIAEANAIINETGQYRPYKLPYGKVQNKGRSIFEAG